ncbi:hypothetical protein Efla_004076 [Eimeria flavescens]
MGGECCKNVLHGVRHPRAREEKRFEDQQKPWPSEPSKRAPASADAARQHDLELSLICSRSSIAPLHPSFGSGLSVTGGGGGPPQQQVGAAEGAAEGAAGGPLVQRSKVMTDHHHQEQQQQQRQQQQRQQQQTPAPAKQHLLLQQQQQRVHIHPVRRAAAGAAAISSPCVLGVGSKGVLMFPNGSSTTKR